MTKLLPRPVIAIVVAVTVGFVYILAKGWREHQLERRSEVVAAEDVDEQMRLRARQAVEVAARDFDTALDFRPDSVEDVERILAKIHERHRKRPLTSLELAKESMQWGAYIGEVARRVRPCHWALNSESGSEASLPIVFGERDETFPVLWCFKRIENGEDDNVWHKFVLLVVERDRDHGVEVAPEGGAADRKEK